MASYTSFLDLYKVDSSTDGSDTFNIDTILNNNWDKIETAVANMDSEVVKKNATTISDWNNATTTGFYTGTNIANAPVSNKEITALVYGNGSKIIQYAFLGDDRDDFYVRQYNGSSWGSWNLDLNTGNVGLAPEDIASKSYVDTAESDAKSYTDTHEAKGNPHSDSASNADVSNALSSANAYTDAQISSLEKIPTGIISMWAGAITNIPSGWALCDGNNGTPNLQDRFIVGAGSGYSVGNTGGARSVTLSTSHLPAHNHSFSGTTSSSGYHNHTGSAGTTSITGYANGHKMAANGSDGSVFTHGGSSANVDHNYYSGSQRFYIDVSHSHSLSINSGGTHTHTISGTTGSVGSGNAHENRPPYYALAFIMKL